jgi:outer membrane protein OmpA-like peptidoglycan-associated protein
MPGDSPTKISFRDAGKTFECETGKLHRFELRRLEAHVLEVEDTNFHHDSAVLLPDYETGDADQDRVTGLMVLRACYEHAAAHPAQKILIPGHADRSGPESYNFMISELRAQSVLHALLGNRSDWVAIAEQKHKVEDYQRILAWVATDVGWDCDPGAVDNIPGTNTRAGVKGFQVRYNQEFGASISEDGAMGPQTWGAIFDVYMSELAKMMQTDAAGLAAARAKLKFLDDGQKAVGCGESFPITPERAENYRSPIDRRVEILFFDPGEEPEMKCHPGPGTCVPEECEIYDTRRYGFRPIPVTPVTAKVYVGARLHANFNRIEGGQNVDSTDLDKRKPRILRPGAIILPNLDIDEDPAAARTRFKHTEVDALADDKVNEGDDESDLTFFDVLEPVPVVGDAQKILLKLDPKDAERVRIWEIPAGKTSADGVVRAGPGKGEEHTLADVTGGKPAPPKGWEQKYIVEALTLAGDPKLPAPGGKAPTPPGTLRGPAPETTGGSQKSPTVNTSDTAKSIYDTETKRAPGDIWVELVQENAAGPSADLKDIGLFTIAPWIMTDNTRECQRVYVVNLSRRGDWNDVDVNRDCRIENHCMTWDLQQGCHDAGLGAAPDADTTKRIESGRKEDIKAPNDEPFYAIDGTVVEEDRWVQDEFEIGYCYAPHQWLHVVLHNIRSGPGEGLGKFVEDEMAHAGLAVFNGISKRASDGIDFGGNLEVSPPVGKKTPKLDREVSGLVAGPSVKEHDRPAPFGKIILGDCGNKAGETNFRPAEPEFHDFLHAQRVQPVLPLDTSWLAVGHVDEFMSFVRSTNSRGFVMLLAEVECMTRVLKEVKKVDGAATMHAGKYEIPGTRWKYDEEFVEDWLSGMGALKLYSESIEIQKLTPIRDRLKAGLDLDDDLILPIPTYFLPADPAKPLGDRDNRTVARNVGMVNLLVVNNHLMVPRPFGPRLEPAKAKEAVEATLKAVFGASPPATKLPPADGHFVWARPGESLKQIAMYFARPTGASEAHVLDQRKKLIDELKADGTDTSGLAADYQDAISDLMDAILDDPQNKSAVTPIDTVAPAPDREFSSWMRIHIPLPTIDVIEGYMLSILEGAGNTVHFIDDFECYHALKGEVHCGTNAKRRPPEETASFTDRWWDVSVYDPDYDTSYDPSA